MSKQLQVLDELISATEDAGIPIWFYGGYALDALEGRTVRPHGDIDCFIREQDQERMRAILSSSGFRIRQKYPRATIFSKMGQTVECLTYKRLPNGMYVTNAGGEGIYPWPDNSFPDEPNAILMHKPVRVISYEALYVFKAGYQTYNPSQALREKDATDLGIICQRIPKQEREELASLFEPLPGTRKRYPSNNNL